MVADKVLNDGTTDANSSEGQKKVIKDIGSTVTQVAAGLSGLNAATAGKTATNAIENNYLTKQEVYEKVVAEKACSNGDAKACQNVKDFEKLDHLRDEILHACEGPSSECAALFAAANDAYHSFDGAFGSAYDHAQVLAGLDLSSFSDTDKTALLSALQGERYSIYGNGYLEYLANGVRSNSTLDYNGVYTRLYGEGVLNDNGASGPDGLYIGKLIPFTERSDNIQIIGELGLAVTPAGTVLDVRDLINAKTPEERALALAALIPGGDAAKYTKKLTGAAKDTSKVFDASTLTKTLNGTKGDWSVSYKDAGQRIKTASGDYVVQQKLSFKTANGKAVELTVAKGADGKNYVLSPDPLKGTGTGTLDRKLNDQKFYNQIKSGEKARDAVDDPQPNTKTQTAIEILRKILGILDNTKG